MTFSSSLWVSCSSETFHFLPSVVEGILLILLRSHDQVESILKIRKSTVDNFAFSCSELSKLRFSLINFMRSTRSLRLSAFEGEFKSCKIWIFFLYQVINASSKSDLSTSCTLFFSSQAVAASYDDSLKSTSSSSVIIPTPIHERENEKYNNNNNHNNINNNLLSPSSNNISLKIEEVSNETQSNSMIEDHHHRSSTQASAATRWEIWLFFFNVKLNDFSNSHLQQFNECNVDISNERRTEQ